MNAPAIPPPAAPMKARSMTVRFFRRVWGFGPGLDRGWVGLEIEAKGLGV